MQYTKINDTMTKEWLRNAKISLRAPEPEDLELMFQMENDTTLWNIGNHTQPFSRYTLRRYIEESVHDIYTDKQIRFIIELPDKTAVGIIDIADFDPHNKRAEVCIGLFAQHREQGIGYAALTLLLDYAFNLLQLNQLYAYIPQDNRHSRNLFTKATFKETAQLQEWLRSEEEYKNVIMVQLLKKEYKVPKNIE